MFLRLVAYAMCLGALSTASDSSAATVSYRIELEIIGSGAPDLFPDGTYSGSLTFDDSLLAPLGTSFVQYGQLDSFSLGVGPAFFDQTDIRDALLGIDDRGFGAGPGGCNIALCGIAFDGRAPLGIVGQFFIPQSNTTPFFNVQLSNTNPGFMTFPALQVASIGTNPPGERGTVLVSPRLSIRPALVPVPVPEAGSVALFGVGGALVAFAVRRGRSARP